MVNPEMLSAPPEAPLEAHNRFRKCARCRQTFASARKKALLCKSCAERKCLRCRQVFLSMHIGNRLCHGCSGFAASNSSTF